MNKLVLLIDSLACGFDIESAAMLASMTVKEASEHASQNQEAIELRKKEITEKTEIMLPSARWRYLTKAASMGVDGYPVASLMGGVKMSFNPALAIQAVKVANEMSSPVISNDTTTVTQVITEMYRDLRQHHEADEVWEMIEKVLPEYIGAVKEVRKAIEKKVEAGLIE